MNVVELSNTSQYDSESNRQENWLERRFGRPSSAGVSALLYACGMLLVLASQWFPMFGTTPSDPAQPTDYAFAPRATANFATAESIEQIPYYLIWLVVFVLAGALIFGTKSRRPMMFGAAIGALGVQAMVVLPVLRHPMLLLSAVPDTAGSGDVHYMSGTFYLVAAFFVLAAALIVGVRGRVLPAADGARADEKTTPDPTETVVPRPSMHDALADSVPAHGAGEADIEFGWSSRRAEVVDVDDLDEPMADQGSNDHEIYRRPTIDQLR